MLGFRAVLVMLVPILIPGVVLLSVLALRKRHSGLKEFVAFVVALVFLVVGCFFFGRRAYNLRSIHSLQYSEVGRVYVDRQEVTDPSVKMAIIEALSHSEWFVSQHGGWKHQVPLEIALRSGKTLTLFVGDFPFKGGVVVGFAQDAGDAFCIGISLDRMRPGRDIEQTQ